MAEVINSHIDGLLKATSRSFHLTLTTLPKTVRDQFGLLYLLARLADTIADSKTENAEALIEALDGYHGLLVDDEAVDLSQFKSNHSLKVLVQIVMILLCDDSGGARQ